MLEEEITDYLSKPKFNNKKFPVFETDCEDEGCKLNYDFSDYIILNVDNIKNLLKRNEIPDEINNLRMGEAVFCGYNTTFSEKIEGFNRDTFELKAEIVEIKNKPSKPNGTCLADFSGNVPKFEDKGIRKRAIIAIGNEDINITGITPKNEAISVVGGCSDYTVLDITESEKDYQVGDIVSFRMNYVSILKAMISKFVEKNVI